MLKKATPKRLNKLVVERSSVELVKKFSGYIEPKAGWTDKEYAWVVSCIPDETKMKMLNICDEQEHDEH